MTDPNSDLVIDQENHVGIVTISRPPNNFFDAGLIGQIADNFEAFAANDEIRAIVLQSEGKHFCAGAHFKAGENDSEGGVDGQDLQADQLYDHAARLIACPKPIIAAVQGGAIGGGLGLALAADFRIACPSSRFSANFVKVGIHPGFGLTLTLPRLIGEQKALHMLLTGRRLDGKQAHAIGLIDELCPEAELRQRALDLATEISDNAPLAVEATRASLRQGMLEDFRRYTAHEFSEQSRLFATADHAEGVRAVRARRQGQFRRR